LAQEFGPRANFACCTKFLLNLIITMRRERSQLMELPNSWHSEHLPARHHARKPEQAERDRQMSRNMSAVERPTSRPQKRIITARRRITPWTENDETRAAGKRQAAQQLPSKMIAQRDGQEDAELAPPQAASPGAASSTCKTQRQSAQKTRCRIRRNPHAHDFHRGPLASASSAAVHASSAKLAANRKELKCLGCADVAKSGPGESPATWLANLPPDQAAVEREWQAKLSPLQFKVLRMKATEEVNSGPLLNWFAAGSYKCAGCGLLLYKDSHKIPTTCGWPAFKDNCPGALKRQEGKRIPEITCKGCGGHLGHVFKSDRYPPPHHERHCVNSASLKFIPAAVQSRGNEKHAEQET